MAARGNARYISTISLVLIIARQKTRLEATKKVARAISNADSVRVVTQSLTYNKKSSRR